MINIDLIVPPFAYYPNIPFVSHRWNSYWFPVLFYLKDLKKIGVKIRFLNFFELKFRHLAKIVGIDCRFFFKNIDYGNFGDINSNGKIPLNFLEKLRDNIDTLLWFDTSDSSGTTQFEVLPYVDRYYKRQLLKDRILYSRQFYEDRIFADFYTNLYNFKKNDKRITIYPLELKYKDKLGLSWNLALFDYRVNNKLTRFINGFSRKMVLPYSNPNKKRNKLLSARFGIIYNIKSISFQRKSLIKFINRKFKTNPYISTGFISKKEYLKETHSSKAILSPFGWGEICLRDFETFIAGAALIKPAMEHLETWPNFYRNQETYISIPWKIEEWESRFNEIFANEKLLLKIAINGQKEFKSLWTKKAKEQFCNRFINMISLN